MRQTIALSCMLFGAASAAPALAEVSVNGFASIVTGIADSDAGYLGYTQDFDFQPDSVAAVQLGYPINDKMNATVQMIARGKDNWEPEMEWAYISYNADNGNTYRAGRLRIPFYMYSDYLDVRYAQPFLRPPRAVYSLIAFSSYTGVDALIPVDLGNSTLTLQPFYGGTKDQTPGGVRFKLTNLMGANATWEWEDLMVRAVYAQTDAASPDSALLDNVDGSFVGLGVKYDAGSWFGVAEYGAVKIDGAFNDNTGAFVAMGYRAGDWTPYASVGFLETSDNEKRAGIPQLSALTFERTEYTLGTRWDYMPNVALKAELSWLGDFNGSAGFGAGGYDPTSPNVGEDVTIVSLSMDTVF